MNFEQIQWNKVFCRIYGLAVIEVMTLSGHLSNIDEIVRLCVHEFWQTIHSVPPLCCSAPSTTKVLWIGKLVDFFSHRYVHKSLDSSSNRHLFYHRTTTPGLGSFFFFSTAADNTLWLVLPSVRICWQLIKEYLKVRFKVCMFREDYKIWKRFFDVIYKSVPVSIFLLWSS